jgi:lysophospholipase L1-like esterase
MALLFQLDAWHKYERPEDSPVILLFGDSWFHYPIPGNGNLSNQLLNFGRSQSMDFVAIGESGLEINSPDKAYLHDATTFLVWEKNTVDMIIISGGGNDCTGMDDLPKMLKPGQANDAASWFNLENVKTTFNDIRRGYERIIAMRDQLCPAVPILSHCYDYPEVTGKGVLGISPWIKPSLDNIGMPSALHHDAAKFIINQLAELQADLANKHENYQFIDTRNSLEPGDWANELHPTARGFQKIAANFFAPLQQAFPDWVRKPQWLNRLSGRAGQ